MQRHEAIIVGRPDKLSRIRKKISFPNRADVFTRKRVIAADDPRKVITIAISTDTATPPEKPKMTLEDVKRGMRNRSIRWGEVPGDLLNEILTKAAAEISEKKEIVLPVGLLDFSDLTKNNFAFLDNKPLSGLYEQERRKDKNDKSDVIARLFTRAGITVSIDDIRQAVDLRRNISWERITSTTLYEILSRVSDEINIPIELLTSRDLQENKFTFINRDLKSLINYAIKNNTEKEKDVMVWLREKAGQKMTADDIVAKIKSDKIVNDWGRLDQTAFSEFLELMAIQLGKPVFLWIRADFSIKHDFLNGKNIEGLLWHLYTHKPDDSNIVTYLHELAGKKVTIPDILWAMDLDVPFWDKVPTESRRMVIEQLATEKVVHPVMLNQTDFTNSASFLDGRTLDSLYDHVETKQKEAHPTGQPDVILALLKYADFQFSPDSLPTHGRFDMTLNPGEFKKLTKTHPILTPKQLQLLFRYKALGIPLALLTYDDRFLRSFGPKGTENRGTIQKILSYCKTIEHVLLLCHQRIVNRIVSKVPHIPFLAPEDIVMFANQGLRKAVDEYNPELGEVFLEAATAEMQRVIGDKIAEHNPA